MPVTIRQIKNQIITVAASKAPLSLMIWGDPGIGKTTAVAQAAAELGIGFKSVVAHLYMPIDVLGMPYIAEGKSHFAPPAVFPDPTDGVTPERGIFFIDELPNCVPAMMSAWGIVILERSTKHFKFPPGWQIHCAGNLAGTRNGSNRLIGALEGRLLHQLAKADFKEFYEYGHSRGMNQFVLGFLDFKKGDGLIKYTGNTAVDGTAAAFGYPSPRSWERTSDILALNWTGMEHERDELISGAIGPGMKAEFLGYLKVYEKLPKFDDIIAGRVNYSDVKSDVLSAIASSLLGYLVEKPSQKRMDEVLGAVFTLPAEWRTLMSSRLWYYGADKSKGQASGTFTDLLIGSPTWPQLSDHMMRLLAHKSKKPSQP